MNKMGRMTKNFLAVVGLFAVLAIAGCDQKSQPPASAPNGGATTVTQPSKPSGEPAASERAYVLYRADTKADKLVAEQVRRPDSAEPEKRALELLLTEPVADQKLFSVMPKDVRLLGLTIRDKVAYADFSKELKTNALGGAAYEILLVNGVVNTLTEFNTIERVQFLVNGRAITTINGHLDLTDPVSRDESMIRRP